MRTAGGFLLATRPATEHTLAIRVFAVADADNLDGIVATISEGDTPVADSQSVARWGESAELLDVPYVGFHKPRQTSEYVVGSLAINCP